MRHFKLLTILIIIICVWSFCTGPAKLTSGKKMKGSEIYSVNIVPIIEIKCSPCHLPSKGGSRKPYDSYENVTADINEIIRRIELDSTDTKFMPRKKAPLSNTEIEKFKNLRTAVMIKN